MVTIPNYAGISHIAAAEQGLIKMFHTNKFNGEGEGGSLKETLLPTLSKWLSYPEFDNEGSAKNWGSFSQVDTTG